MHSNIVLETKLVGKIEGKFFIPSFQRGYRWGQGEVERLLDDVHANGTNHYCLQPLVVKRLSGQEVVAKNLEPGEWFEVIYGQQRLTTLYLIYSFLFKERGGCLKEPAFSLVYETRKKSAEFLKSLDPERKKENIDFWFICEAYETIQKWFGKCIHRIVPQHIGEGMLHVALLRDIRRSLYGSRSVYWVLQ